VLCVAGLALVMPFGTVWLVAGLGVLGVGLGVFTPANNSVIMTTIPACAAGTGGGLVNLTRALGTALGVALVTLALHLSASPLPAVGILLVAAAGMVASSQPTGATDSMLATVKSRCASRRWHQESSHRP
jgi:hypothetical protein